MINRHSYVDGVLYLYFDYNYEFGKMIINKPNKGFIESIKDYLKKIKYKGTKVVIMVGSIAVLTLVINGNNIKIEDKIEAQNNAQIVEKINEESEIGGIDKANNNEIVKENVEENNEQINLNSTSNTNDISSKKSSNNKISSNSTNNKTNANPSANSNSNVKESTNNSTTSNTVQEKVEESKEVVQETPTIVNKNLVLLIHKNEIIEIDIEDYVIGVVAAEMPASFNIEALKAQSVAARTYALKLKDRGVTLTDNNSTQNYIDENQMKLIWGADFNRYYEKIKNAVEATKGLSIKYNGYYIDSVYHSTSNGYTRDSSDVWGNSIPYLKSVDSVYDKSASSYIRTVNIDFYTFNSKLGVNFSTSSSIELTRDNLSYVTNVKIDDINITGKDFRDKLGLRSCDFDIEVSDNNLTITTRGYGHGVGMSQYGANGMAQAGYNYLQILHHYYTNVVIN